MEEEQEEEEEEEKRPETEPTHDAKAAAAAAAAAATATATATALAMTKAVTRIRTAGLPMPRSLVHTAHAACAEQRNLPIFLQTARQAHPPTHT